MSLNMYLGEVQSQTQSMNAMCTATIQGMEQVINSIDAFVFDAVLQGQTYDSAKAFFAQTFRPLAQGIIYLCEELIRQNDAFPNDFQSRVASTDVIEQEILEQMRGIDQTKAGMEVISNTLPGMQAMMGIFDMMKQKLQEKLEHLREFNSTSSSNYDTALQLAASIAQGLAEVQSGKGFSPASGTFSTQGLNMEWTGPIQKIAEDKAHEAYTLDADSEMNDSLSEESIWEKFGKVWNSFYIGSGQVAGTIIEGIPKVWNGFYVGSGRVIGDIIEGVPKLFDYETWENAGYVILNLDEVLPNMCNVLSDSFIKNVWNGDAESIAEWITYAFGQVGTMLFSDKGVSKVNTMIKETKFVKVTEVKVPRIQQTVTNLIDNLSIENRLAFADTSRLNLRSSFDSTAFEAEEKLSTYQFAKGKSNFGGSNHTPSLSNRQIISSLKGTENFTRRGPKHILEGEINGIGKAVGYHTETLENTPGKIVAGTERTVNNQGVYKAKVEVNGVPKTANRGYSTFFPKDWSPQKIVDNINEAYNNKRHVIDNTYKGVGLDGIEITMYIDNNGKIISAFPKE